MKILILCVMLHGLSAEEVSGQVLPIGRWKEQAIAPEFLLDYREETPGTSQSFFYGDKRGLLRPEGFTIEQVKRIAEDVGGSQSRFTTRSRCTCESLYEVRDLGEGHYPQYITASRCKPKACQNKFNSCRLLHYMVHVLTPRNLNGLDDDHYSDDSELPETPLPEPLRHKWRMKTMSIAVACVPGRRN